MTRRYRGIPVQVRLSGSQRAPRHQPSIVPRYLAFYSFVLSRVPPLTATDPYHTKTGCFVCFPIPRPQLSGLVTRHHPRASRPLGRWEHTTVGIEALTADADAVPSPPPSTPLCAWPTPPGMRWSTPVAGTATRNLPPLDESSCSRAILTVTLNHKQTRPASLIHGVLTGSRVRKLGLI
ncbi:hypothetical protein LX32DRAFT_388843 [Colletotrichum zoysiae]|uniref:Uncharacterized protein n=1 Tax=Colletotrichum zoysiae TaxID=1216348 RepID=A0AAD9HIX8_9PEZI|nr:hypothetical protein LX32DRAFT_388843 [Colletotrichum zoysiae]